MNILKYRNNPLVIGTIILTSTSILGRLIGFFYRIFISHRFGEESMGIYQLIGPVLALSFSFAAAGVQTAISKYVASETASHDYKSSLRFLLVGFILSLSLSSIYSYTIYHYAEYISYRLLHEPRCTSLLRILAFAFPFSAAHSCINGYYYGIKKTALPAITGLTESICRTGCVFLLYQYAISQNITPTIRFAVIGIVVGEISSIVISYVAVFLRFYHLESSHNFLSSQTGSSYRICLKKILRMSIPLSTNRMIVAGLQSVEAIYFPLQLQSYGLSREESLRMFGVLTGMALCLVLFPCALTNSASVLLLPIVSEADNDNNQQKIASTILSSLKYSTILGFLFTGFFFLFGKPLGNLLFNSTMAGEFIMALSFICPFLYITTTFSSILHGLGKTSLTLFINVASLSIRIAFVFFVIPKIGIQGYFLGVLCAQLFSCICCILGLRKYLLYLH